MRFFFIDELYTCIAGRWRRRTFHSSKEGAQIDLETSLFISQPMERGRINWRIDFVSSSPTAPIIIPRPTYRYFTSLLDRVNTFGARKWA
uniref:Uncharacterized protein n=1 Tax=Picea glauca TaxID=3330 RepID=A0A101M343_PICGL|nr:hypothetical protein ABT39_MTgene3368 [Picea glauca]QHR89131.1 hypothetical protein Q903MT_gene3150 [Picea sitchensis]